MTEIKRGFYSSLAVSPHRDFQASLRNPGRDKNGNEFSQCLGKVGLASFAPLKSPIQQDWKQQIRPNFCDMDARFAQRSRLLGGKEKCGKRKQPLMVGKKELAKGCTPETVSFQPVESAWAKAENGLFFLEQGLAKNDWESFNLMANCFPGPEGHGAFLLPSETGENIMARIAEGIGPLDMIAAQGLCLRLQSDSWGEVLVHCQVQQDTVSMEISARHPAVQELLVDQAEALHRFFQEANPEFKYLKVDVSLFPNEGENVMFYPGEGAKEGQAITKEVQAFQHRQYDREFSLPDESAVGKKTAENTVASWNPGARERETTGAVQAETFLPGEMTDQVFTFQVFGGTVENPETQNNLSPVSNVPSPAELWGKVISQIAEHVEYIGPFNAPGIQELRLRLQPELLGEVLVRIRRQQGVLSAEIITRNAAVQEMLENQLK